MGDRVEFHVLDSDAGADRPLDQSSLPRPDELGSPKPADRERPNSGTPLRETGAKERHEGLRVITISLGVFSVGVTLALLVQLLAGHPQISPHGAVVSCSKICSDMGLEQLRRGGSAVDSALTTMLCVGLVHPQYAGIGGGGFMLIHNHKTHNSTFLDFRESAPRDILAYKDDMTPEKLKNSGLGVGVPGEIAGVWEAHKRFGKLSWKDIFHPVIRLAEEGFLVTDTYQEDLERRAKDLREENGTFAKFYGNWEVGTKKKRPEFAKILKKISDAGGPSGFYEGEIAEEIVTAVQEGGGPMTMEDLKRYRVHSRHPLSAKIGDFVVETAPVPGSGAILIRTLKKLEAALKSETSEEESKEKKKKKMTEAEYFVKIAEAMNGAYPCRALLGDPTDRVENMKPLEKHIMEDVNMKCPEAKEQETRGTSHVSVIDTDELMVSATTSMNWWFGSLLTTESGLLLNNQLADFERNSNSNPPAPDRRPLSSMVPTVVYHKERPCLQRFAIGGVNGSKIVTGVSQVLANLLLLEQDIKEAFAWPRIHCNGSTCLLEDLGDKEGVGEETVKALEKAGIKVELVPFRLNVVGLALKTDNSTLITRTDPYNEWDGVSY